MTSSTEPQTFRLDCHYCGHDEAYLASISQHRTARCVRCHKYIQHLSLKEYLERAYPEESKLRKEIKEIVESWCNNRNVKFWIGWKRLYRIFEKKHGIDLYAWSEGDRNKKKRKRSGLDMALEMGVINDLHAVALANFEKPATFTPDSEDEKEVAYPPELIERIEKQIPDSVLQVIKINGFDVIGIYRLIKEHIIVYQAEQFYSDRKKKEQQE